MKSIDAITTDGSNDLDEESYCGKIECNESIEWSSLTPNDSLDDLPNRLSFQSIRTDAGRSASWARPSRLDMMASMHWPKPKKLRSL